MMRYSPALKTIFFWILFFTLFLAKPHQVLAKEYQNCLTGQSCTIGEFLFDDTYTPDASASCTLTSRYPDGSLLLNSVSLTAQSNGWYSYSVSPGSTEGIYPSQICCTTQQSERLCLDKTFELKKDTGQKVWDYSNRSLTSFGDLVSNIWDHNTRSLTSFGDLIANLWSYNNRTLSKANGGLTDVTEIKKIVKENRLLLEQLINKPVVKTYIDESKTQNLSEKIEKTKSSANNIYSTVQNLQGRIATLNQKWNTLDETELKNELLSIQNIIRQEGQAKSSDLNTTVQYLKSSWDNPLFLQLANQTQNVQNDIENLQGNLNLYGKRATTPNLTSTLNHLTSLYELVGEPLSSSTDPNLYGFIKKTAERIAKLDASINLGQETLKIINSESNLDHTSKIQELTASVNDSNQIVDTRPFLIKTTKETITEKNRVLSLIALAETNKKILATNTGESVSGIWLEEGSIIFRAVATNPSSTISQKVNVKFLLPQEIKKEHIIHTDVELKIEYDAIENALVAMGDIYLAPQETKTFAVETEDIWRFDPKEIDALKQETQDLVQALKNTSYYSQALSTKADIFVGLEKIISRQDQAVTPENRIKTYRESSIEMNGIEEKINSLREMIVLTQNAGFSANIFNMRSLNLWGIILILIVCGIFLTIYNQAIKDYFIHQESKDLEYDEQKSNSISAQIVQRNHRHKDKPQHKIQRIAKIASIVLLISGASSIGFAGIYKAQSQSENKSYEIQSQGRQFPYMTKTKSSDTPIPVRSSAVITATKIATLKGEEDIRIYKLMNGWAQISTKDQQGEQSQWIRTAYLEN